MKRPLQCMECEHLKVYVGWRGYVPYCYCCHPNQKIIQDYYKLHGLKKHVGRVGKYIIETDSCERKWAPLWCPKNPDLKRNNSWYRKAKRTGGSYGYILQKIYRAEQKEKEKGNEKKKKT